jgi:hypothetical protein
LPSWEETREKYRQRLQPSWPTKCGSGISLSELNKASSKLIHPTAYSLLVARKSLNCSC